jgi:hypothetical protein
MRLLEQHDDERFSIVDFQKHKLPPYAILSHVWGPINYEVVYADVVADVLGGKAWRKRRV